MDITKPQKYALYFYLFLVVFWLFIRLNGLVDSFNNFFYSFLFGLIPLFGGVTAMLSSKTWGRFKSAIGKSMFFVGLGLALWGFGETIWSYYNFFLNVPAPYPSVADIGFAPSIFFYSLGAIFLAKATGAKFALKNKNTQVLASLGFVVVSLAAYYFIVEVARGGVLVPEGETPLKIVLDIAYPLGGYLGLAVSVVVSGLSFKYLGGRYKMSIISILLGLTVMFIGDTIFSYTTTAGTYYNANFGDLVLTTGLFLLTFGILGFYKSKKEQAEIS